MFRAFRRSCEPAPLPLDAQAKPLQYLPLMCLYQMSVACCRRGGVSWAALWTQKGPARDHERDIVRCGPHSAFVDKWIFMLIKSHSDMSENCGKCGIILTARPYTRTTVVSNVCGLSLSGGKLLFLAGCRIQLGRKMHAWYASDRQVDFIIW